MIPEDQFLWMWRNHSRRFGDFRVLKTQRKLYILKDDTFFSIDYDPIVDRSTQPQLIAFFQNHLDIHLEQERVIAAGGTRSLSEGVL